MDKIQKVTREYRASRWAEIIKECRNSGETIKAWCEKQGINEKSFYYWQRRFREKACQVLEQSDTPNPLSLPSFAEISVPQTKKSEAVAVTLRIGEVTAEVYNGAEPITIESVIRTLKTIC